MGSTMGLSSRPPDPGWLRAGGNVVGTVERTTLFACHMVASSTTRCIACEDYSAITAATLPLLFKKTRCRSWLKTCLHLQRHVGPWVKYPHFAVPEPRIGFARGPAMVG